MWIAPAEICADSGAPVYLAPREKFGTMSSYSDGALLRGKPNKRGKQLGSRVYTHTHTHTHTHTQKARRAIKILNFFSCEGERCRYTCEQTRLLFGEGQSQSRELGPPLSGITPATLVAFCVQYAERGRITSWERKTRHTVARERERERERERSYLQTTCITCARAARAHVRDPRVHRRAASPVALGGEVRASKTERDGAICPCVAVVAQWFQLGRPGEGTAIRSSTPASFYPLATRASPKSNCSPGESELCAFSSVSRIFYARLCQRAEDTPSRNHATRNSPRTAARRHPGLLPRPRTAWVPFSSRLVDQFFKQ